MERYAQIPVIEKGVVFSDPYYDESVWCQYRKAFTDTNWLLKMKSSIEDGYISFQMTLGRPTVLAGVALELTEEGMSISFPGRYEAESVEIGMDTASIFCGLQEHWQAFGQEASIRTGTDGIFGDLTVFTCQGEKDPAGFVLIGGIEACFMNEEQLFAHFASSFNGREISSERFESQIHPNSLALRVLAGAEMRNANEARAAKAQDQKMERDR